MLTVFGFRQVSATVLFILLLSPGHIARKFTSRKFFSVTCLELFLAQRLMQHGKPDNLQVPVSMLQSWRVENTCRF